MFKTLTEFPGAPGNEHAVRDYMREELGNILMKSFKIILEVFLGLEKGLKIVLVLWLLVIWTKLDLWLVPLLITE